MPSDRLGDSVLFDTPQFQKAWAELQAQPLYDEEPESKTCAAGHTVKAYQINAPGADNYGKWRYPSCDECKSIAANTAVLTSDRLAELNDWYESGKSNLDPSMTAETWSTTTNNTTLNSMQQRRINEALASLKSRIPAVASLMCAPRHLLWITHANYGIGKTHFAVAVGWELRNRKKVFYVQAEQWQRAYFASWKSDVAAPKELTREVIETRMDLADLLIIDEIHDLFRLNNSGGDEYLVTNTVKPMLDTVLRLNKSLILVANRSPQAILDSWHNESKKTPALGAVASRLTEREFDVLFINDMEKLPTWTRKQRYV